MQYHKVVHQNGHLDGVYGCVVQCSLSQRTVAEPAQLHLFPLFQHLRQVNLHKRKCALVFQSIAFRVQLFICSACHTSISLLNFSISCMSCVPHPQGVFHVRYTWHAQFKTSHGNLVGSWISICTRRVSQRHDVVVT